MEKRHPGMVWDIFIWTPLPPNYPFFYFAYIHVGKALHMLKHYCVYICLYLVSQSFPDLCKICKCYDL